MHQLRIIALNLQLMRDRSDNLIQFEVPSVRNNFKKMDTKILSVSHEERLDVRVRLPHLL